MDIDKIENILTLQSTNNMGLWKVGILINGIGSSYTHEDLKTAQIKAIGQLLNKMYKKLRDNE